jgi:hypothetical protein
MIIKNAIFWDVVQPPAHSDSSLSRFFYPEDGGDTFLRNIGSHKIYMHRIPEDSILHNFSKHPT